MHKLINVPAFFTALLHSMFNSFSAPFACPPRNGAQNDLFVLLRDDLLMLLVLQILLILYLGLGVHLRLLLVLWDLPTS